MRCDESLNNIKLGVTLSNIKVAEGGCVVAGKAELSGVSASILTDKQRVNLEKAYTAYNQILDVAYENAGAIAETYNSLTELLQKTKEFAKNYKGGTAEAAKAKAYEKELKKAQKLLRDSPDVPAELKTALTTAQANAQAAWDFYKTGQPCTVSGNSGGGDAYFSLPLADCNAYAKAIENETQALNSAQNILAIKNKIVCGCYELGVLKDLNSLDKDCKEIITEIDKLKSQINQKSKITIHELSFQGQVTINGVCVSDLNYISTSKKDLDPLKYAVQKDGININNGIKLYISDIENRDSKVEALREYIYNQKPVLEEKVEEEDNIHEFRIRAFMRMLRDGEGTLGDIGYETLFGGESFIKDYKKDWSDHPNLKIKRGKLVSSASGAYQVMGYTWKEKDMVEKRAMVGINDFSQESQDLFCVILLKYKRPDGWNYLLDGKIEKALNIYSYEWASLPPPRYGQPANDLNTCIALYEANLKEEKKGVSPLYLKKGFLQKFK